MRHPDEVYDMIRDESGESQVGGGDEEFWRYSLPLI